MRFMRGHLWRRLCCRIGLIIDDGMGMDRFGRAASGGHWVRIWDRLHRTIGSKQAGSALRVLTFVEL